MTTTVYTTLNNYANTALSCSNAAYLWVQDKQADCKFMQR